MSYQGGPAPGNGYWPGHGPPNSYNIQSTHPQLARNRGPQYQMSVPGGQAGQYWDQNGQIQYGPLPQYVTQESYVPAPTQHQVHQHHQAAHPVQPVPPVHSSQQLPAQNRVLQQYQDAQTTSHSQQVATSSVKESPRMFPAQPASPQLDPAMLLISLAEEFFDAAHELAPSVATSMTVADIEAYEKLIATGLGCLDTVLKRIRVSPRVEATIRLRYACVLFEETENFMEAETALSKGITLCEMNHYFDLKYCMQFLLAQLMFQKNPKASMKALDGYISDAQAYHHYSWVYAFRFLRASHALESGNPTDTHTAIQNFRSIASLADQQGDRAIYLMTSLMEALAYMKSTGPDSVEQIQRAIAAAWTYQLNADNRIPQLLGLTHILDVACSLRKGDHTQMLIKLKAMQKMMDEALKDPAWSTSIDVISIPINRAQMNGQIVSQDTRMILGIGKDGRDHLMMSFLNKKDTYAITYLLCGIVLLHKNPSDEKGFKYLETGLASLSGEIRKSKPSSGILSDFVATQQWRGQVLCYFHIYMAFCLAAVTDWVGVKKCMDEVKATAKDLEVSLSGPLGFLTTYLTGVYHQGSGDLDAALKIFQDKSFDLPTLKGSNLSSADHVKRDITILAALNALWVLQNSHWHDPGHNAALISRLEPFCASHPNKDIETAFNLIVATVNTNPPGQLLKIKNHLRFALAGAQETANTQFLCITLNVMCSRFFANVVGEQAEKSAKAAAVQARKSGNILWMSVADGMLADCYELQGKKPEAQATLEQARRLSQRALPNF